MTHATTRRRFLKRLALGAAALAARRAPAAQPEAPMAKPNIVILVADDLGWNDVGYHGSEIRTPRLDAFAKQGIELDRFYVCPVCTPTRAGLMTGRYPHRYGLRSGVISPWRNAGLPPEEQTIADMLAQAGYRRRACFGKWHLGHHHVKWHPLNRGFTTFYGHYNGAIDYFTHEREGERDWHRDFEPCGDEGYSTDLVAREAVRFVRASQPGEPFLLYVPFNAVHSPLQAPEAFLKQYGYDPKAGPFGGHVPAGHGGQRGRGNTVRQTYAAMVTAMDAAMGRILDALDAKGIAEDTLVLFFSDNGGTPHFGGDNTPLRGNKGSVWEGGVRVPAAVRWPRRLEGGRKLDTLMGYVDVMPTLRRIAGIGGKPPHELDGTDVLGVLAGQDDPPDRVFFLGGGAVVTQRWKLVEDQLFRIDEDPCERRNVAAQHPKVVARLGERLAHFRTLASKKRLPAWGVGREGFTPPKHWRMPED